MKEVLKNLKACRGAVDWVGDKTLQEAWETCPRGDWMLWLYSRLYPDNLRDLTLAKGHCANTVRHLMTDERSLKAVDVAIAYGEGTATIEALIDAANGADAAVADNYSHAATSAACAVHFEVTTAYSTASYAAYSAAAYSAAAHFDARAENERQTADICRKYLRIDL